ncbi:efflux RND transporter periplasmic adaptor subunit [Microbulbifer marinus]|uniref:Membrane fusion protein, Cu(I)/Ag(I) efflux system n=1 Tax=Microbulbifer marinus TaxID=658218 RepID=A0A1H4BE92_9GAMM|nr:efflux RND transporter periplasmic adaptor subunit [Microbulbifer marinus]SEA46308.1 membrane fusion protein, Cu(I)/Ag(I) efflux system [Microbulbifer marinus]
MNNRIKTTLLIALGVAIGISAALLLRGDREEAATGGERKPLYWVAPMDPNYRRDKPGKSPMGMDLVPVYEEEQGESDSPGTVRISPEVVNNLGVRTAAVERGRFDAEIRTVGYVQYDEKQLVQINPRVEGWIEKLYVDAEGDPVNRGMPLYTIYSPELVNAQEELVLALKHNNRVLIDAARERLRALQLPRSAIDELIKTRKVRRTVTVYAPQSGVVDKLNVREGIFVKPGMAVMSIASLDEVWVIGEVFERQAALVNKGDPVTMRLDYLPGQSWTGTVDYIYPTLDEKTRTARIRARFGNPDHDLKPNMFAQLTIHARRGKETLLIPAEALIRTGGKPRVVLALGEGRFKSVNVQTGRIGEQQVEILAGLREGERIVTSAQFLIDSESSKTSDFMRMDPRRQMDHSEHGEHSDHGGHKENNEHEEHKEHNEHNEHENNEHENNERSDHNEHSDHNDHSDHSDHSNHSNHSKHDGHGEHGEQP